MLIGHFMYDINLSVLVRTENFNPRGATRQGSYSFLPFITSLLKTLSAAWVKGIVYHLPLQTCSVFLQNLNLRIEKLIMKYNMISFVLF